MKVQTSGGIKNIKTVWMEGRSVVIIDQRDLPHKLTLRRLKSVSDVAVAIRDMWVRGAPAIGVTAAYGMAISKITGKNTSTSARQLKATRPTAHDLFFAIDYMSARIIRGDDAVTAAREYAESIEECSRLIGKVGARLIKKGDRILTHCNAGALATVDYGTALAPIREAHRAGKKIFVWVDETRPRLQGAQLTAWEMLNEGIAHRVIADNAAGHFMRQGEVDIAIVGADRIALNGDTANKIGTYEKAVLAHENKIPFYIAAPVSTFDASMASGDEIVIEERSEDEVLSLGGRRVAPKGSHARNPAFDVTPSKYISGYITEAGLLGKSDIRKQKKRRLPV